MRQERVLLTIRSLVWGMTAAVMAASAVSIHASGRGIRAQDPMAEIHMVEAIAQHAVLALPHHATRARPSGASRRSPR